MAQSARRSVAGPPKDQGNERDAKKRGVEEEENKGYRSEGEDGQDEDQSSENNQ